MVVVCDGEGGGCVCDDGRGCLYVMMAVWW